MTSPVPIKAPNHPVLERVLRWHFDHASGYPAGPSRDYPRHDASGMPTPANYRRWVEAKASAGESTVRKWFAGEYAPPPARLVGLVKAFGIADLSNRTLMRQAVWELQVALQLPKANGPVGGRDPNQLWSLQSALNPPFVVDPSLYNRAADLDRCNLADEYREAVQDYLPDDLDTAPRAELAIDAEAGRAHASATEDAAGGLATHVTRAPATLAQARLADLLARSAETGGAAVQGFWAALAKADIDRPANLAAFLALCDGAPGPIGLLIAMEEAAKSVSWPEAAAVGAASDLSTGPELVAALALASLEQMLGRHPLVGTLAEGEALTIPVSTLLPAAVIASHKLATGLKIVRHPMTGKPTAANVITDTVAQTYGYTTADMTHEAEVVASLDADGAIDLSARRTALERLGMDLPETSYTRERHRSFAKKHGANLMFTVPADTASPLRDQPALRRFLRDELGVQTFVHGGGPSGGDWARLEGTLKMALRIFDALSIRPPAQAQTTQAPASRTRIFISYAHRNQDWLDRVTVQLRSLELQDLADVWDDRRIGTGKPWSDEIERAIAGSRVAVLLLTPDFLASEFVCRVELPRLFAERHKGLALLPVLIQHCGWRQVPELAALQIRSCNAPLSSLDPAQIDVELAELLKEIAGLVPPNN